MSRKDLIGLSGLFSSGRRSDSGVLGGLYHEQPLLMRPNLRSASK